ncbi:MAG: P-II family nitrogen regulator [Planctomycetota bacterium]
MKLIIAIIQPGKLEAVKDALSDVEVVRLTVLDCQGFGRTRGHKPSPAAANLSFQLLRKVQLQIGVNEAFVDATIDAITRAARGDDGGDPGDGKIFVLPMDDCIRIRTGERGEEAI